MFIHQAKFEQVHKDLSEWLSQRKTPETRNRVSLYGDKYYSPDDQYVTKLLRLCRSEAFDGQMGLYPEECISLIKKHYPDAEIKEGSFEETHQMIRGIPRKQQ